MPEEVVLGFDFGMKRIGVAVGNTLISKATALKNLNARDGVPDWTHVKKLITEWQPALLLVGIPLNMDNTEQSITYAAKKFAKKLRHFSTLPVIEIDERLTTVEARTQLFEEGGYRKLEAADIDSFAAKLIIEKWFYDKHPSDEGNHL